MKTNFTKTELAELLAISQTEIKSLKQTNDLLRTKISRLRGELDQTHNGWSNYETWRVALEIFDGWEFEDREQINREYLEEIVEDVVFSQFDGHFLAMDYARAFLSKVNYFEIEQHLTELNQELI